MGLLAAQGNNPQTPGHGPRPASVKRAIAVRCQAPYCWDDADYKIPEGVTPRTKRGEMNLCVDCFEKFIERLETSVMLPGEECEWKLTLHHAENLFDGGHDWRRNLLRSQCKHRTCAEARTAKQSDLASLSEARA